MPKWIPTRQCGCGECRFHSISIPCPSLKHGSPWLFRMVLEPDAPHLYQFPHDPIQTDDPEAEA